MRPALILTLLVCALASVALAQAACSQQCATAAPGGRGPTAARLLTPPGPRRSRRPPRLLKLLKRRLRIRRGHAKRHWMLNPSMCASIAASRSTTNVASSASSKWLPTAEASGSDPGLERFADPRKVQVELKDELDREQTSEQLANDYAEQAREVLSKEQAVQDFITKRRKTLDDLSKQNVAVNRQDLEVALANLARQPDSPETQAQMRDIDRRLSEAERLEKDLPARRTRAQQEAAGAAEELAKLKALEQSYEKESKAFAADALSAHNNRLGLADRLEYYLVRAQAEDVLEQGRKATQSVQHLSASPEVDKTLNSSAPSAKSDADLEQLRSCIQQSGDVKACHEKARQAPQE